MYKNVSNRETSRHAKSTEIKCLTRFKSLRWVFSFFQDLVALVDKAKACLLTPATVEASRLLFGDYPPIDGDISPYFDASPPQKKAKTVWGTSCRR